MRVVVTGTRGIPYIMGGVETHCEELYPRLSKLGAEIILIRRSCYVESDKDREQFKGVKLKDIYAPRKKSLEAIVHTFLAICYAKKHRADLIHIHAIGPGLMVPLARMMGLKVVVTNHGPDYDRQKWGKMAKLILQLGERFSSKYANTVIVISKLIENIQRNKYNRNDCKIIHNGVSPAKKSKTSLYLDQLGVEPYKYVIATGRFVEEKGFDRLITTFARLNDGTYKLLIAGDADHESDYSLSLKKMAKQEGVILTGFIKGEQLWEVMTFARLFVLPSFHEGLPISLLEAMSYGLNVLVSNIPANKEIGLDEDDYFDPYDLDAFYDKLSNKLKGPHCNKKYNLAPYDWNNIAKETMEVYEAICKIKKMPHS